MNILFFSSNSPYSKIRSSKGRLGGAEISLRIIAEEFANFGYNICYYSTKKGKPLKKNINGVSTYHYPDIYIPILHKNMPLIKKSNEKLVLLQKKSHIEKIIKKENIDLIHTYSTYPDTFLSISVAKKYGIPIVQRVAGRAWYNLLRRNPFLKGKIEWTFNNVDMLLFISDFIKDQTYDYFNKLGFKVNTPCEINDIGINYKQHKNIDLENLKSKYDLSDDEKIILCVESFKHHSKRQDILIKALPNVLEKINNLKLIFIGKGPIIQRMKDLAYVLGVHRKIRFLGEVPHRDELGIMSIAKIVAHPTEFEGLSTVMKESLALGKPFLVSDIEPMNNIIKDGYNGMLAENNPIKFAEKIVYLLENNEIRKSIGENAAKDAKKYFDSEKNILKYEKLFLDICQKNKRRI